MFGNNDPLFTTGYQMNPSLAGFFTPMTLLLSHLVRNGLVFTRVVYWMTPYFGEYTFYLIGPYFWLGVGTYLSLQIGSAPPGVSSADASRKAQEIDPFTSNSELILYIA